MDLEMFEEYLHEFNDIDGRCPKIFKVRYDPLQEMADHDFRSKYRFSKNNMVKIIELVRRDLEGDYRGGFIKPELQVVAAIRSWARNEVQDDCSDIHGFSQPTMSLIKKRVATALASKSREVIKMPTALCSQEEVIAGFAAIKGFSQVIGAVDCTHIKIPKVSGDAGQCYINRKGFYSINVQVVCDSKLKINDIVAHWRGSTHDSRIFNESSIKRSRGRLLGDSGYLCTPYLFTPVLNPANRHEVAYNAAHISTRNVIERCFGVWKQRFRGLTGSLDTIKVTIVALAVLHNLAIDYNDDLVDEDHEIIDDDNDEPFVQQDAVGEEVIDGNVSRAMFIRQNF